MKPLPNVRKLFLPDRGHIICDVDLSGADAQVVAWEANDERLKKAFKAGDNVHNMNGKDILGDAYKPDEKKGKYKMYDACKRTTHGTNYAGKPPTISKTIGWPIHEVRFFQEQWFRLHPAISEWHRKTERDLQLKRMVSNKFGNRIIYFDRPDNLLPKGLAWIPQSTIAGVTGRAALALQQACPWAEILLQVHDSLIFQVPTHRFSNAPMALIKQALLIPVPYPQDELIIPWGLAFSDKSWGDVKKCKWEEIP